MGETRRAGEPHRDVGQPHARKNRDAIPGRLAVKRDGVLALGELVAGRSTNASSASLFSCKQTTSGRRSSNQGGSAAGAA